MSERPQPAYDGDEPYIFVTYAHEDTDIVYPHIRWLQKAGFNVWWDEGISPGSQWRAEIARSIRGCSLLLYFVTPKSVAAEHCTREVNFALDEYHRPVLAVHLAETRLPDALALSLSDRQAILRHALEPEDYDRKLASAVATYLDRPIPEVAGPVPSRQPAFKSSWLFVLIGLILTSMLASVATWMVASRATDSDRAPARFAIQLPTGAGISGTASFPLAISADGRSIFFSAESLNGSRIFRRELDDLVIEPITGYEEALSLFLSADEQSILSYNLTDDVLNRVPVSGGRKTSIAQNVRGIVGLSDRGNGTIYFAPEFGPIHKLSASNGTWEPVTRTESGERHVHPFLMEDTDVLLFAVSSNDRFKGRIEALFLETGQRKVLTDGLRPQVTSSGHLLFARSDSIWAAPFDTHRVALKGVPVEVLRDVSLSSATGAPQFAVSASGSIIYVPKSAQQDRLVWVDTAGNLVDEVPLPESSARYGQPRISPDGQKVLVRINRSDDDHFWIYSLERRGFTQVGERSFGAFWSVDSSRIIYSRLGSDGVTLVQSNADGTGDTDVLIDNERDQYATSQTPDGKVVLYHECSSYSMDCDIGQVTISGNPSADLLLNNEYMERHPALSFDGQWLAYESNRSGRFEVYVRPYPEIHSARWQVSTGGGSRPIWSPDGGTLYYTQGEDAARQMMAVDISNDEGFSAGSPEPRFEFESSFLPKILRNHDLHPDGDRFLMAAPGEAQPQRLIYVENWLDEVERLSPTDS